MAAFALRRRAYDGQADPPRYAGIKITRKDALSGTALALAAAMHTPLPSRGKLRNRRMAQFNVADGATTGLMHCNKVEISGRLFVLPSSGIVSEV